MSEIVRVMKPGGRVLIHDIRFVSEYAPALASRGLSDVKRIGSKLGRLALFVMTFGSLRPDIVMARKPD